MDKKPDKKPKILLWGTFDTKQPRIRILIEGIMASGYDLDLISYNIWAGYSDKSLIKGAFKRIRVLILLVFAYIEMLFKYIFSRKHDFILISYPGLLDIFVVYPFAKLRGERIIWDVFIPMYECVVEDRKLFSPPSIWARGLYCLEYLVLRLVDRAFLDTKAHARYLEEQYKLPDNVIGHVFVGAENCFLNEAERVREDKPFEVLFFGKFIPLQGIETIIEAAKLIQEKEADVRFKIVGQGQESDKIDDLIRMYGLKNVERIKWLDYPDLITAIRNADVCLGIFGKTNKTQNVIPNKVFQALAMNKPVITLDTPAIRELYDLGSFKNLLLVRDNRPETLSEAILQYKNEPLEHLETLKTDYTLIGKQFMEFLNCTTERNI